MPRRPTSRRRSRDALTASIADARDLLQLGVAGTVGVTTLAESVHAAVLATGPLPWLPGQAAARVLGRVAYAGVRGIAGPVGKGGDALLAMLQQALAGGGAPRSRGSHVPLGVRSAMSGLVGDRLEAMGNAVALPMTIEPHARARRLRFEAPAETARVLFVHGLCMSDRHWQDGEGVCFGERLAERFGHRPVYLRYNSGLPIVENGRRLAALLERRQRGARAWAGPLHVVAHSLGGLVVRSAIAEGQAAGHSWPSTLHEVVFIGTPHEGAPLERAGALVDRALLVSRFSAPWAALGRLRSVAIRQLGRGGFMAAPADGAAPAAGAAERMRFHAVAGRLARRSGHRVLDFVGDGLVPLDSALAQSLPDAVLRLHGRTTFAGVGHLELIRHPGVADHLTELLATDGGRRGATTSPNRRG